MPRPVINRVPSLLSKSLLFVANRLASCDENELEKKWTDPWAEHVEEAEKSVSTCSANPFEHFPSALLEVITDILYCENSINVELLKRLITAQTKELDIATLPIRRESMVAHLLQLATVVCPKLSVLLMGSMEVFPLVEDYKKFLPQLKHLQELDVSCSQDSFDDSCMNTLGIYCRDLRKLLVAKCNITDQGIELLCGGDSHLGKEVTLQMGDPGQCKSLRILSIMETGVTQKGVQRALQYLPHLEVLDHLHVTEALADIHQNLNGSTCPKYSLRKLLLLPSESSTTFVPFHSRDLGLAASLCPFVTHLDLHIPNCVTDSDLQGLMSLDKICELKLSVYGCIGNSLITFDDGVAPILKAKGSSLETIEFHSMLISVRLRSIVEYCPNLTRLKLQCSYSASASLEEEEDEPASRRNKRRKTDFVWENLKELELNASGCFFIPLESLLLVLTSSPALKQLSISNCKTLDDYAFERVFECHSFCSLEELKFLNCHKFTKHGIDLFMNEQNALKTLEFSFCGSVRKTDVLKWRRKAEANDWDIDVSGFQLQQRLY